MNMVKYANQLEARPTVIAPISALVSGHVDLCGFDRVVDGAPVPRPPDL